jgi:hypothetical protein
LQDVLFLFCVSTVARPLTDPDLKELRNQIAELDNSIRQLKGQTGQRSAQLLITRKRGAGMPHQWYDENADNPPWIKALAEVRRLAPREGYCYQHVQAIIVSIDQYAEKALGNRDYFLNKPYGIGRKGDVPWTVV